MINPAKALYRQEARLPQLKESIQNFYKLSNIVGINQRCLRLFWNIPNVIAILGLS